MLFHNRMPSIPVECGRNSLFARQAGDLRVEGMPATCGVHMCGDGGNILDDASFRPGFELEIIRFGMALITHLGHYVRTLGSSLHHQFHFIEGSGHWLLHINVLTQGKREHGDGEMRMVWRTDTYSFNVITHLVKHLAEVLETRHIGKLFQYSLRLRRTHVYITESHKIGKARLVELHQVRSTLVANADTGKFYFVACLAVRPGK